MSNIILETWQDQFQSEIANVQSELVSFMPNAIQAIIILLIGFLLAFFIVKFSNFGAKLLNLNAVAENPVVKKYVSKDFVFSLLPNTLAFVIMMYCVLQATTVLGLNSFADAIKDLYSLLPKIFLAAGIVLIGLKISEFAGNKLTKVATTDKSKNKLIEPIKNGIVIASVYIALQQVGFDLAVLNNMLLALTFGLGLAIGLGGKDKAKQIIDKHFTFFD